MLTLFQTEWCPYSHQVRFRLTELQIDFVARQVPADPPDRVELRELTGTDTIPTVLFEDGTVASGTEEILPLLDERYDEPPGADRHRLHERADAAMWLELLRAGR